MPMCRFIASASLAIHCCTGATIDQQLVLLQLAANREVSTEPSEDVAKTFDPVDAARVVQASKAAEAAHEMEVAQQKAIDTRAKMQNYTRLKKAAQDEVEILSATFDHPNVDLPAVIDAPSKCEHWCSTAQFADRTWEKKCNWKDCKACSACTEIHSRAAVEKKAVVARVMSVVYDFMQDKRADTTRFMSNVDLAIAPPVVPKVDVPAVIDAPSKCENWCSSAHYADRSWEKKCNWKDCNACSSCTTIHNRTAAVYDFMQNKTEDTTSFMSNLTGCTSLCVSEWVRGQTLQAQHSDEAWKTRCGWKGCENCAQCTPSV